MGQGTLGIEQASLIAYHTSTCWQIGLQDYKCAHLLLFFGVQQLNWLNEVLEIFLLWNRSLNFCRWFSSTLILQSSNKRKDSSQIWIKCEHMHPEHHSLAGRFPFRLIWTWYKLLYQKAQVSHSGIICFILNILICATKTFPITHSIAPQDNFNK